MALGLRCRRCLLIMGAVLLPPIGVYLRHGCYSMELWFSVLLTVAGYYFCLLFIKEAPVTGYGQNYLAVVGVLCLAYLFNNSNDDVDEEGDSAYCSLA